MTGEAEPEGGGPREPGVAAGAPAAPLLALDGRPGPAEVVVPGRPGARYRTMVDLEHPLAWVVPNALSAADCAALLRWVDTLPLEVAPITTGAGPVMRLDVRNNERAMVDAPALAAQLYERVLHTVPDLMFGEWRPVGVNERLRVYRYGPGQVFRAHFDGAFRRSVREESQLTLMFYLDDDCDGGQTWFIDADVQVRPRPGLALLFQHRMLHEGALVTRGRKTVLRTDVMFQRV